MDEELGDMEYGDHSFYDEDEAEGGDEEHDDEADDVPVLGNPYAGEEFTDVVAAQNAEAEGLTDEQKLDLVRRQNAAQMLAAQQAQQGQREVKGSAKRKKPPKATDPFITKLQYYWPIMREHKLYSNLCSMANEFFILHLSIPIPHPVLFFIDDKKNGIGEILKKIPDGNEDLFGKAFARAIQAALIYFQVEKPLSKAMDALGKTITGTKSA